MLQLREKEILDTLEKLKGFDFVLIGGYAVNAYTLPRFSVDCDIVLAKQDDLLKRSVEGQGYILEESDKRAVPYGGEFFRYEKEIEKGFKVSMDMLVGRVVDRQTGAAFTAEWVFKNSSLRLLKGKTITKELKLRIVDLDALIVMKFISCRNTDIRDIFMLMPSSKDRQWIKYEISKRISFEDRFSRVRGMVTSKKFKDNLQGVYGYIDLKVFEKHKNSILDLK